MMILCDQFHLKKIKKETGQTHYVKYFITGLLN
jgi:hypothetical protein